MLTIIRKGVEYPYVLSKAQEKEIREKWIKNQSTVKIKLCDERYSKTAEGKPVTPYIEIHPQGWLIENGQKERIIYHDTAPNWNEATKKNEYFPRRIGFKGQQTVWSESKSMDLLFFLAYCSPHCQNGEAYEQNKMALFQIYSPARKAESELAKKQAQFKIQELLFHEERGLTEKDVKSLAKGLYIPNVDVMENAEVRLAVFNKVTNDAKALEQFNIMYQDDDILEKRTYISDAISLNLIQHVISDGKWYYIDDKGNKGQVITRVASTSERGKVDELYEYFRDNKTSWVEFKSFIDKQLYDRKSELTTTNDEELEMETSYTQEKPKTRGNPNFGKKQTN